MTVDIATGEIIEPLTAMEKSALTHAEAKIERGLKTFVEVGQALAEIRDSRLYRSDFDTFETYCQSRWGMDRRNANRTIEAAEVVAGLGSIDPTVPKPSNIGQARELSGLPAESAADTMRSAHKSTAGNVTAKAIREARETVIAKQAETDTDEFPALTHYAERGRPADVVRLAGALRQYDEPERERRLAVLDKTIAAEKRAEQPERHLSVAVDTQPDYAAALGALRGLARQINALPFPATELSRAVATRDSEIKAAQEYLTAFIAQTPEDSDVNI